MLLSLPWLLTKVTMPISNEEINEKKMFYFSVRIWSQETWIELKIRSSWVALYLARIYKWCDATHLQNDRQTRRVNIHLNILFAKRGALATQFTRIHFFASKWRSAKEKRMFTNYVVSTWSVPSDTCSGRKQRIQQNHLSFHHRHRRRRL